MKQDAAGRSAVAVAVARVAALGGAAVAPALVFAPGYSDGPVVGTLLGCCAVAAVLSTYLLAGRLNGVRGLLAGLPVAVGAIIVLAAWRPGQVSGVGSGAVDALLHSGARILTTTAPTPATVDTLTLPFLGSWLCGAAAGLALRAGRPLLALLPPLILLAAALVLAGPDAAPGYHPVALLVAAAAVVLGTAPEKGGFGHLRLDGWAVIRVIPVAVMLGCLTAFAGPYVLAGWSKRPPDPRSAAPPPAEQPESVNPLSYLPAWGAQPGRPLLAVQADRPVELRWVTLAEFTGHTWLPEAGYRPAGEKLPGAVPPPPRVTSARAVLNVAELPGPWLPSVGRARRVQGLPIAYEQASGTLVARDERDGRRRYTVTGDVPGWRAADAADADVPTDPAFDRYRELPPGAPPRIREVAAVVAGTDSAYRQAARLAEHLRRDYVLDTKARGGHGYASLAAFLVMPGEGRRGSGTADQFASAFAVMARAAGLASRVVVGFGRGVTDGGGRQLIRTGDAVAWGEIYFDRVGWVPFDVVPGTRTATGSGAAPQGAVPPPAQPAVPPGPRPGTASPSPAKRPGPGRDAPAGPGPLELMLGAMGAVILLVPPIAVPALRRRRTRRRLVLGSPEARIIGAWAELLDGLRLAGRPAPAAATAHEVIACHPEAGLEDLAVMVSTIGFGSSAAVTFMELDADQAGAAADLALDYVATLRRARPRHRRLLWWLDPRPLFW